MWRRPAVIALFFVVAAALYWLFAIGRLPPGVETKGPENWLPWVSLLGAIVSLVTGVVTLALKVIEVRATKPRRKKA